MTVEKRIELARLSVISKIPLLAPLVSEVRVVKNNNIPTMACSFNKKMISYNEHFVSKLSNETLIACLLHEYFHYLFIHNYSFTNKRDWWIMNIATDSIINHVVSEILKSRRFLEEIGGVTFDLIRKLVPEFKYRSDSDLAKEDSIYIFKKLKEKLDKFMEDLEEVLVNIGDGEGEESEEGEGIDKKIEEVINKHFSDLDEKEKKALKHAIKEAIEMEKELKGLSQDKLERLREEIRKLMETGKILIKSRGTEFLGIVEIIDLILYRKRTNWKQLLRDTTSEIKNIITDYNLLRPSRITEMLEREYGVKTFLPDLEKEETEVRVIIGIDVSGSISDGEYREFVNEVYNLMSDIREVKGYIILWEADVTKVIDIRNGWNKIVLEELKKRTGYGGTVIESFFKKAGELAKNKKKQTYLIILTDGETELVEKEWVKDWKKVIFIISKYGSKESLKGIEHEKNVYMAFMD